VTLRVIVRQFDIFAIIIMIQAEKKGILAGLQWKRPQKLGVFSALKVA
jgi:hypothetical protein